MGNRLGELVDKCRGIIYDTIMSVPGIVIDTNVLVAALRSQRGASYKLLMRIDSGTFGVNISVPLILEYEDAAKRLVGLTADDVAGVLDYICAVARQHRVFYLWRPFLRDPKDDMILELAVVANCSFIVTFNQRDFQGAELFGIRVVTPKEFLQGIGELL
jgi:putative PIN family toxin of toxin-antitoxin system